MSQAGSPTEIAREALRRLALNRMPPTPENFRELYHQISGVAQAAPSSGDPGAADIQPRVFRDVVAQVLESSVVYHLSEKDDLLQEGRVLAGRVRTATGEGAVTALAGELKRFVARLEERAEDVSELRNGMHRLLRLLVDNVSDLIVEDTWISHELDTVRQLIAQPAAAPMIDEAEQYLREVLLKQGVIKRGLRETKATLKNLASSLFDHLGAISADAEGYGSKIEAYSKRIRESDDIGSLNDVLGALLNDTTEMRERAAATVKDVAEVRARARAAEKRIVELEADLVKVGAQVSEDHLTRALNRRGFEDAFVRESALAVRHRRSLCLAVLDIDNFKHLNDTHGHLAGDRALVHLAALIRETLRPSDTVARIGGEEFVLLLPEIALGEARELVVRLQRELTKRIFLHENERVLITFSAGVARWQPGESRDAVVARADTAQYDAKSSGKNKVVVAEDPVAAGGVTRAAATK